MSYNSDSIKDMIECLDKHKYSYTQYKHKNGYCSINSDVLLEQLKINEQEIRAKAIDEFAERLKYEYGSDEIHETIDKIAEQMKEGEKGC